MSGSRGLYVVRIAGERRRRLRGVIAWALVAASAPCGILGAIGCSSSGVARSGDAEADASVSDGGDLDAATDAPRAPTYTAVYQQVLLPNCALPFCHAGSGDYLQLADMDIGYASLVDASAAGPDCAPTGLKRVDPGHPETSLVYLKITAPPCGAKMPLSYGNSGGLAPADIDQIRQWITLGAPND